MKRITLWLAVSLTTFTLGITVTLIYLSSSASIILPPLAIPHDTAAAPTCFPGLSRRVENQNTPLYFPRGAFDPKPEREKFILEWYTSHLRAMGEPTLLYTPDSSSERYRFLWLRSFHPPVAVHVWRVGDSHFITVKQTNGQGGYRPGKLITYVTRSLTKAEWDYFVSLLERSCYWHLPTTSDEPIGTDGAQWILEGVREERYHVVDRWTPQSGDFREACLYLLKLSNLGIDPSAEDTY